MVVGFLFAREAMAEVPKASKSISLPQAFRATDERPMISKLDTIDLDMVETTPVVLLGKLWRLEWVRQGTD